MKQVNIDEILNKVKTVVEGKDRIKYDYLFTSDTAWDIIEELTKRIISLEASLEAANCKDESYEFSGGS